jgi:hypothetical protein
MLLTGTIGPSPPWAVVSTRKTGESFPTRPVLPVEAWTTAASFSCSPSPCQTPSLLKARLVNR